jgi:hypothetical protein
MEFENVMKTVILAAGSVDYFIQTVKLGIAGNEVEVKDVDAHGFSYFFIHMPFRELLGDQLGPVVYGPFVEIQILTDLHFDIVPSVVMIFCLDVQDRHFTCPVIRKIVGVFQLNIRNLFFFRNNGIDQGDKQVFIFFAAKEFFKSEIDSGVYSAHNFNPTGKIEYEKAIR